MKLKSHYLFPVESVLLFFIFVIPMFTMIAQEAKNKVLIIGIDGCRPDALQSAKTKNIDKLVRKGAYSFKAKTDEISSSGICWTGMMTGVWHEKHKVISNAYKNPNVKNYPHFFKRIKQVKPELKTYSIIHWAPLHKILQKGDADVALTFKSDMAVVNSVCERLKKDDPDVMFVHLDDVDHAGHAHGYGPELKEYLTAIEEKDKQVGQIIEALKERPDYKNENWLILLSTDHGGSEKGHGKNIPEHTTIFYIASGKSTKKGEIRQQVNVIDIAVTAMHHLGIDISEDWNLDGKVSGLKE